MKKIILLMIIIGGIFITNGCCKKKMVAGLTVTYENVPEATNLYAIKSSSDNWNNIIDTLDLGVIDSSNQYTVFLPVPVQFPNYILYLESNSQRDTISNIFYETEGKNCNMSLVNLSYKLNGIPKGDFKITLQYEE